MFLLILLICRQRLRKYERVNGVVKWMLSGKLVASVTCDPPKSVMWSTYLLLNRNVGDSRAHAAMTIFWPNAAKTGKIVEWHFRISPESAQNQNNDQSSPVKCIGPISHEPSLHFSSDPFTKISFAAVILKEWSSSRLVSSPQPRQLPRLGWWTRACYVLFCISWMRLFVSIDRHSHYNSKDLKRYFSLRLH